MGTSEGVDVVRVDARNRYEIRVEGRTVGSSHFRPAADGTLTFDHTVVDPAESGHGYGTTLVSEALADVARRGETIVPQCPFVIAFLQDNEVPGLVVAWTEDGALDAAAPAEPA